MWWLRRLRNVEQENCLFANFHPHFQFTMAISFYPLSLSSLSLYNRIRQVELVIEPGQSLGLMIRGGIEYGLGIYVTGVDKDSVADRAGLMVS